jgi:hypothetical protein
LKAGRGVKKALFIPFSLGLLFPCVKLFLV